MTNVTATRLESDWVLRMHLDGNHTVRARTWRLAHDACIRMAAQQFGVTEKEIVLDITFSDVHLHRAYLALREARRAAQHAQMDLDRALRAASNLFSEASSTRDAGAILGYSHQYIAKVGK
jgi:galactokinase